jgi:hypothetical protein
MSVGATSCFVCLQSDKKVVSRKLHEDYVLPKQFMRKIGIRASL